MSSERTPLTAGAGATSTSRDPSASTAVDDVASFASASTSNADAPHDATPRASYSRWPRRRGYSVLALALVLGTLVGAVLYAVEPSATAVPRPEAATPASASAETLRVTAAAARALDERDASTSERTGSERTRANLVRNDTLSANESANESANGTPAPPSPPATPSPPLKVSWTEILEPEEEEPKTLLSLNSGERTETVASPPPHSPPPPPRPPTPPSPLSLETRHDYAPTRFATLLANACAAKRTASACTAVRDVYGCAWTGASCVVDCGTFQTLEGCATQGDMCAFDAEEGACNYATYGCSRYVDAATCTTAAAECEWNGGVCFNLDEAAEVCAAKPKAECQRKPGVNATEEVPCVYHIPDTMYISGEVVYIGADVNITDAHALNGTCVVDRECGLFTHSPDACGALAPKCAYDRAANKCVRAARVEQNHRLCGDRAPSGHRTCPTDPYSETPTFCNFNFQNAGFCQRCRAFDSVDACQSLPSERGRQRCASKCFPSATLAHTHLHHHTNVIPGTASSSADVPPPSAAAAAALAAAVRSPGRDADVAAPPTSTETPPTAFAEFTVTDLA